MTTATRAERLNRLADLHDEWVTVNLEHVSKAFDASGRKRKSDYNQHHVDIDADGSLEDQFAREAAALFATEPTTAAAGPDLTGAELAEFNRLHPRDRKGKFADHIGDAIASGVPARLDEFTREQLRQYATKKRGLVLPRGASVEVIKDRLMQGAGKQVAGAVATEQGPLPDRAALLRMRVPELRELAKTRGVKVSAKAKKADIVDALHGPGEPAKPAKQIADMLSAPRQPRARKAIPQEVTGSFLSASEATTLQDRMLEADPWPTSQQNALINYAHQNYHMVNGLLRDNEWAEMLADPAHRAPVEKAIRDVSAAMRPLPQPVKVLRFVDPDILHIDPSNLEGAKELKGQVFQDPGFMSTSLDPDYGDATSPFTRLDIDIPAGSRAAYLDHTKGIGFEHERELLLDAGTKLLFTDVVAGPEERQVIIKARVIA